MTTSCIFYISQRLTLWYFVFLYLIFLSQQVLYFLLSTLVLTLYIDVVLSLSIMSNFMPFVPSDLSANAQPPENAVNEQTDRWTDRQTNNNIHKHPWMLSVSHLDTSACQIVGHFFQALCMQYTNPSPWMVGRTDEHMKWQQYPSASMLAKGKSSGNICISNSMPFLPSDLSANVQKPENVVNRPIDGQTDGRTKEWQGGTIAGGYCYGPLNLV